MNQILRIAIQKSGRLSEDSLKLFKECGMKFNNYGKKLKAVSDNFPIEFLFLRDDDIPGYVEDSIADLGIVGENVHLELEKDVQVIRKLGFSKCRLSLAIPRGKDYLGPEFFEGKSVATSYPNLLGKFFLEKGIQADIHEISGSVEIAPSIGLSAGICDLVSSGSTLLSNGLEEKDVVMKSQAILIGKKDFSESEDKILQDLLFRLESVYAGKNNKYILMNAPNDKLKDVIKILPGMKSPTVVPLAEEGWSSLHSVINEDLFWEKIDALKEAGAEGILVVPIEKMIV